MLLDSEIRPGILRLNKRSTDLKITFTQGFHIPDIRTLISAVVIFTIYLCFPVFLCARSEKDFSGWSFYMDNDFFTAGDRDFDYTGGFAYSRSGNAVKSSFLSLDTWLEAVDDLTGVAELYHRTDITKNHTQEFGLMLFTPKDLAAGNPINDQHPYASLFFLNNARVMIDSVNQITYQSILTLGLIGLPLAGDIQTGIHDILDADKPNGWDNQISDGGELTFRYSVSRSKNHSLPARFSRNLEIKSTLEANLGFTTDVGVALSLRAGKLQSPWWAFNVHSAEYISMGSPTTSSSQGINSSESYFWTGLSLKYRIYNVFLQGQFRHSEVTYDPDQLEHLVAEAWIGYTYKFESGFEFSGFVRRRSSEINLDTLNDPVWGGFIIGRSF
jgi:hypothetical protein